MVYVYDCKAFRLQNWKNSMFIAARYVSIRLKTTKVSPAFSKGAERETSLLQKRSLLLKAFVKTIRRAKKVFLSEKEQREPAAEALRRKSTPAARRAETTLPMQLYILFDSMLFQRQ